MKEQKQLTKEQADFLKFCVCYNTEDEKYRSECYRKLIEKEEILQDHGKGKNK